MLALVTAGPILAWFFASGMFLVFAVHAVVLDGYGPVRSISMSARLVGGILGRLLALLRLLLALFVAVVIPSIRRQSSARSAPS